MLILYYTNEETAPHVHVYSRVRAARIEYFSAQDVILAISSRDSKASSTPQYHALKLGSESQLRYLRPRFTRLPSSVTPGHNRDTEEKGDATCERKKKKQLQRVQ